MFPKVAARLSTWTVCSEKDQGVTYIFRTKILQDRKEEYTFRTESLQYIKDNGSSYFLSHRMRYLVKVIYL